MKLIRISILVLVVSMMLPVDADARGWRYERWRSNAIANANSQNYWGSRPGFIGRGHWGFRNGNQYGGWGPRWAAPPSVRRGGR